MTVKSSPTTLAPVGNKVVEDGITTKITAKDGQVTIYREMDVEAIVKANRAALNDAPSWRPYAKKTGRNLRHVAEVPVVVIEKWLAEEGINAYSSDPDMQKRFRRKLDDYTNRDLRTFPGKLGVRRRTV